MNPLIYVVLVLAIIGYVWRRSGYLVKISTGIEKLFFTVYLPLAMFWLLASQKIDIWKTLHDAGWYYLAIVLFIALMTLIFKQVNVHANASALALSSTFSNIVLVGLPVFSLLDMPGLLSLLFLLIPLHAIILMISASLLNLWLNHRQTKKLSEYINIPPLVWAIFAGVLFSQLTGGALAQFTDIKSVVSVITQLTAFFVLGFVLAKCSLDNTDWKVVALMSGMKLLVMPVFVFASLYWINPVLAAGLAVIAGLPAGINPMGYAAAFKDSSTLYASSVVLVTTVGSIVTLPIWLWLMGQ